MSLHLARLVQVQGYQWWAPRGQDEFLGNLSYSGLGQGLQGLRCKVLGARGTVFC